MRTICRHPGMTDVQGNWEWEPDLTAPSIEEIVEVLQDAREWIVEDDGHLEFLCQRVDSLITQLEEGKP